MTPSTDLFGDPIQEPPPAPKHHVTEKRGYAATPGTGPDGKTCRQCAHYCVTLSESRKRFPKCGLMRAKWTHGTGTDIKASSPACKKFDPVPEDLRGRG